MIKMMMMMMMMTSLLSVKKFEAWSGIHTDTIQSRNKLFLSIEWLNNFNRDSSVRE